MDRANGRGPAWIWPAVVLGLGAVAAGVGCGAPIEPEPSPTGLSPKYAVACEADAHDCDGGTDAGRDGGPDGGHDGGQDGGHDGGQDGGPDGGHDGGHDGGQDGGPDGGHDGGTDGGCDAAAMEAAALRGEAVDPGACKWNIPPNTRDIFPINFIWDLGPVNIVVKLQATDTKTYGMCSQDEKTTASGSAQVCVRPGASVAGLCGAGSYGSTKEDGTCSTPFCPCEGADGECREPSCALHKDNKQFGGGIGGNISANNALSLIPVIGQWIPKKNPLLNFNVIGEVGGGFGTDTRNGSGSCFNCCPNGNPKRDNIEHINAELKVTGFLTIRMWKACITGTANAGWCWQRDWIDRLECDGAKTNSSKDMTYGFWSMGNIYAGVCLGSGEDKKQFRGGLCAYDQTSQELRCGIGWLTWNQYLPLEGHRSTGGGTTDICLF
jgi:hypothetical protein